MRDKVAKVIPLEKKRYTVYDIGMHSNINWFFANDILVHNSVFFLAEPLIKKRHPEINIDDPNEMSDKILQITSEVQDFLNGTFDIFAKRFFNVENHIFDLKQEVIAKTGIWTGKKRYALWNINIGGVPVDELEIKGIDTVRTSFPAKFRNFLSVVLVDILKGKSEEEISKYILDFKSSINSIPLGEIAIPTSVKGLSKYKPDKTFAWKKGTPIHVKSALAYNELLEYYGCSEKYDKIREHEKIYWFYLKPNKFNLDSIAFKNYDDPPEIVQFIEDHIDRKKIFEGQLLNKLESFYSALKWPMPSSAVIKAKKFFKFKGDVNE